MQGQIRIPIEAAMEVFANPYNLRFYVVSPEQPGDKYLVKISRGSVSNFKIFIKVQLQVDSREAAVRVLRNMLETFISVAELKINIKVSDQIELPLHDVTACLKKGKGKPSTRKGVLTQSMIDKIIKFLEKTNDFVDTSENSLFV